MSRRLQPLYPFVTKGIRAVIRHVPPQGRGIHLAHIWTQWRPPDDRVFVSRERGGARLQCDLRDELSRIIYYRGWMDPALEGWMRGWLRPGDLYLDVGAHIGYLTALAARAVGPTGRVIAIEPAPDTFTKLAAAFAAPRFSQVELVEAAVAARPGAVQLYAAADRWSHQAYRNSLHAAPGLKAQEKVTVVALDDMLPTEHVRLLKVDVEGSEPEVLEGAARLVGDHRCDALVVEINPAALVRAGASVDELVGRLAALGFHPHRATGGRAIQTWWPVEVSGEFADAVFLPR